MNFFKMPMNVLSLEVSLSSVPAGGTDAEAAGVEARDVCVDAVVDTAGDGPADGDGMVESSVGIRRW